LACRLVGFLHPEGALDISVCVALYPNFTFPYSLRVGLLSMFESFNLLHPFPYFWLKLSAIRLLDEVIDTVSAGRPWENRLSVPSQPVVLSPAAGIGISATGWTV
jgi:hypothetical protein